jgi:EpsI family protein
MPGSGWEDGRYQTQWVPLDSSKKNGVNINKYVVSKGTEKNLVFYWYQGRERITTNEYKDRILLIWDAITKQRTDGALVRIVIPLKSSDGGEEIQCGIEFIQKVIPILGDYLPS